MEKQRTKAEIRDLVLNKKTHVLRNDLEPEDVNIVFKEFDNNSRLIGSDEIYGFCYETMSFNVLFPSELKGLLEIPMSEYLNAPEETDQPTKPEIDMEFIDKAAMVVLGGIHAQDGAWENHSEESISNYCYSQAHAMYKARQEFINKLNI